MSLVYACEIIDLTLDEVKKNFPNDKFLNLNEAEVGLQPPNTYVIGKFVSASTITCSQDNRRKKVVLKQVLPDSASEKQFEIFAYGNYCKQIESCISAVDTSRKKWVIIKNAFLHSSVRLRQNEWTSVYLTLSPTETPHFEWTLFVQTASSNQPSSYLPLVELKDKGRNQIMAVVVRIVKATTKLARNNSRHTVWLIKDLSCGQQEDMLIQIFFNTAEEEFPVEIAEGDIVRLSLVVGERYLNKVQGKVYNANFITVYRVFDGIVRPYCNKCDYILTETDLRKVLELSKWWQSGLGRVTHTEKALGVSDKTPQDKCLEEINVPGAFNLYCQIWELREVDSLDITVIRVVDGTYCSLYTNQIDLMNATQNLNSQTDIVIQNSTYIDITLEGRLRKSKSLEDGSFVCLKNISCIDDGGNMNSPTVHEFSMSQGSEIVLLEKESTEVRTLQKRILSGGKEFEEQLDSQNSAFSLFKKLANLQTNGNEIYNYGRSPSKRLSTPGNSPRTKRKKITDVSSVNIGATQNEENYMNSVSKNSGLTNGKDESRQATVNVSMNRLSTKKTNDITTSSSVQELVTDDPSGAQPPTTSGDNRRRSPRIACSERVEEEPSPVRNVRRSLQASYPVVKEKLDFLLANDSSSSLSDLRLMDDLDSDDFIENTGLEGSASDNGSTTNAEGSYLGSTCPNSISMSLSEFLQSTATIAKVPIIIKSFGMVCSEKCTCKKGCFHDLIWGKCENCGKIKSPSELRRFYDKFTFSNSPKLKCLHRCSEMDMTVVPVIIMELEISDPDGCDTTSVTLAGDQAADFLGLKASFSIFSSGIPQELKNLLLLPQSSASPIVVSLEKIEESILLRAILKQESH